MSNKRKSEQAEEAALQSDNLAENLFDLALQKPDSGM